ncbi:TPA: hypothetical protein UOA92_000300 [Stenotrophomonas maltophilia]|nr:hypothetical protein [Stenotrophomonas maltophilia]
MSEYPEDHEIRVKWGGFQLAIVFGATTVIWVAFWLLISPDHERLKTVLTLVGLNIDIVGVVWASLSPPYYGAFADGGELEFKRKEVQERAFRRGMLLVALGFLLQGLSTIL